MNNTARTPARSDMFAVDECSPIVPGVMDVAHVHRKIVNTSSVAKRAKPDI